MWTVKREKETAMYVLLAEVQLRAAEGVILHHFPQHF